jgi:transcriptional regulator with AAA-type ATPase domain
MPDKTGMESPTETEIEFDPATPESHPQPFLYLVLEADRPLAGGARYCLDEVQEVVIGRGPERAATRTSVEGRDRLDIRASAPVLSKDHAMFRREADGWTVQDLDSRNGVTVNGTPIEAPTKLNPGDIIALGRLFFVFQIEDAEYVPDLNADDITREPAGLLTLLPSLQRRIKRLRREAGRGTAITLIGETGTGKEITAKAIHAISNRRGSYIGINCGAIPRDLIQSELFGYTKGAFSGATETRRGFIREAHEGTLLLDEIVAAPEQVQVALLRAIQEHAVTPVGERQPQPFDVRFIAAAQKPLAVAVAEGKFREDLQARLEAFRFELPPLRERMEDVGIFVAAELRKMGVTAKDKPRLSSPAAIRLLGYHWPRNIRELAQVINVAWGGARDGEIGESEDLPKPKDEDANPTARLKQQLIAHMRATRGNVAEVGRRMNRPRSTIHLFLERFGLDANSFRDG